MLGNRLNAIPIHEWRAVNVLPRFGQKLLKAFLTVFLLNLLQGLIGVFRNQRLYVAVKV